MRSPLSEMQMNCLLIIKLRPAKPALRGALRTGWQPICVAGARCGRSLAFSSLRGLESKRPIVFRESTRLWDWAVSAHFPALKPRFNPELALSGIAFPL
jgi:hypothetical protein